jgi:FkbM family methyltransferase
MAINELGTSIGFVALNAIKKSNNKIICLEANTALISTIEDSFKLNGVDADRYQILNKALSNKSETLFFSDRGSNELGKVVQFSEKAIEGVSLTQLVDIIAEEEFVLISDIEGAEINFLKAETHTLLKCKMIIIELHETTYEGRKYNIAALIQIIQALHFELIDKSNNTYVFSPINSLQH